MNPFVCSLHVNVCTKLRAFMCGCAHVCEGEARLLCRGEADTSMVALCLLALEAKGHKTGINYIERKVCVCMPIVDFFFLAKNELINLLNISSLCWCAVWSSFVVRAGH